MQFLFDHLTSLLVASSVLLLALLTRTDASMLSTEQTAHYAARAQVQTFTRWMQQDLSDVGENYGNGESAFLMPTANAAGMTTLFQFSRDSLVEVAGVATRKRVFVRYRLVSRPAVRIQSEPAPVALYGVERDQQIVDAPTESTVPVSTAWVRAGGGPGTLSQFRIVPHDRNGRPTASVPDTDFLRIRMSFVPPYDNHKRELHELHWGTTVGIRPF